MNRSILSLLCNLLLGQLLVGCAADGATGSLNAAVTEAPTTIPTPTERVLPPDADGWMWSGCLGDPTLRLMPRQIAAGNSLIAGRITASADEELVEDVPGGSLVTQRLVLEIEDGTLLAGRPIEDRPIWVVLEETRRYYRDSYVYAEAVCLDESGSPVTLSTRLDRENARGQAAVLLERFRDGYLVRDVTRYSGGRVNVGPHGIALAEFRELVADAMVMHATPTIPDVGADDSVPPSDAGDPIPEDSGDAHTPRR